jgi:phospholipid-transporting ATPase
LYTKGADNVITERMNPSKYSIESEISNISKSGLRTLMVAMKVISHEEYSAYRKKMEESTHDNR